MVFSVKEVRDMREFVNIVKLSNKLKKCNVPFSLIVQSESMTPCLYKGQKILIIPINMVSGIEVGDIIVFSKFVDHLTVHRVVRIEKDNIYKTKGDNNLEEDTYWVFRNEIIGIVNVKKD